MVHLPAHLGTDRVWLYQYAMVGEPGLRYLWILSRTPSMAADTHRKLVSRAAAVGYDVSKIRRTPPSAGAVPR